jgi:hypothetical protein
MDCYKDLSPSREALFAMGNVRFLLSFLAAALIRHLFRMMPVKSFSGFLSVSYQNVLPPTHNEINRPKSCRIDRVTGLHA